MVVASKGVVIAASDLGKWKTATTMVAICGLLFLPSIPGGMIQDVLLFIFSVSMWVARQEKQATFACGPKSCDSYVFI